LKETTWCLKLLKFVNRYPLVKDLKSFSTNLSLFFAQDLEQKGLVYLEIPKKSRKKYKWRAIVNQDLWKEIEGDFKTFQFRNETEYQEFVFKRVNQKNYAICKIAPSSTHIGFYIVPLAEELSEFTTFFEQLNKLIEGRLLCMKEWDEFNNYKELIFKDDVTDLFNQRKLDIDLEDSIRRYEMNKETFFVFFIDLDKFKQVNDGHGHLVGTSLLNQVGEVIKEEFRDSDFVYRYGGDEFVVIVRDVKGEMANKIANRLLESIKSHDFIAYDDIDDKEHKFQISASIGIAGFPFDATSKKEILSLADRMMYEAKEAGRGTVCQAKNIFAAKKSQNT
jgi:diguanylate cyclase (GGDEF)-like protein